MFDTQICKLQKGMQSRKTHKMNSVGLQIASDSRKAVIDSNTADQSYICRACDQIVLARELNRHHARQHPEICLDQNIYDFMEMSENSEQNAEPDINNNNNGPQCGACSQYVLDSALEQHHLLHHRNIPTDVNIYVVSDTDINNNCQPVENLSANWFGFYEDRRFDCWQDIPNLASNRQHSENYYIRALRDRRKSKKRT